MPGISLGTPASSHSPNAWILRIEEYSDLQHEYECDCCLSLCVGPEDLSRNVPQQLEHAPELLPRSL